MDKLALLPFKEASSSLHIKALPSTPMLIDSTSKSVYALQVQCMPWQLAEAR